MMLTDPIFPCRLASGFLLLLLAASVTGQELFIETPDVPPADLDRIYVRGLSFLNRNQKPDGAWPDSNYGSEPAVVGLSVVAMLAHGDDPNTGPYAEGIRRGLNYLLAQVNKETGYIGRTMYNHGFGTLALAESYGMVNDARIGPALEKAVRLILFSQSKNPFGAWRYAPESSDADTTVTGAQMVALYAARNAGLPVPEAGLQQGLKFLRNCQTGEGGVGYTSSAGPNGARTAIFCTVMALAKEKNTPAFKAAFRFLQTAPAEPQYQQYFLYYASQAYFHASPEAWRTWNRNNIQTLKRDQNSDGSWGGPFGTTFSTAASLLSMALNYRYLPIYER